MMVSAERFISEHRKDTYEELIALRGELLAYILRFERGELTEEERTACPSPETVYKSYLSYLGKLCELTAERYNKTRICRDEAEWLFVLRGYFRDKGIGNAAPIFEEIEKRRAGKRYELSDHVRAMVYSMLTNMTKWHRIVPHLGQIDELFFDYDADAVLGTAPKYFIDGIFALSCGNMKTEDQMQALPDNIRTLQKIEKEYGSVDAFVTSARADVIVKKLSKSGSPYKMNMMGEALAWEYIRNVGVDGAKPDTHLRRFLGGDRMGTGERSPATVDETLEQVAELSEATGMLRAEVDGLIWSFCASGYEEICTATPHCEKCPLREYCRYDGRTA